MAGSSPASRRSLHWSSPDQLRFSDFLSNNRNSELSHKEALAKAHAEHNRVREEARRVFNLHEQQLEIQRLQEHERKVLAAQRKEAERIEHEKNIRREEERLRALELETVPKLPPKPRRQEPTPLSSGKGQNGPTETGPKAEASDTQKSTLSNGPNPTPSAPKVPDQVNGNASNVTPAPATKPKTPASSLGAAPGNAPPAYPLSRPAQPISQPAVDANAAASAQAAQSLAGQDSQRYREIHANLKRLRAGMIQQAQTNMQLKSRMGDMRRELRKSMGQLSTDKVKGINKAPLQKIQALLQEALSGSIPSVAVDPADFVVGARPQLAANDQYLPSLFIYLLNQFAKAVIVQFTNECAAAPRRAEPVGVITAQIFSSPTFQWRGQSLIDILMAKFCVVCPVLFGCRGNERTEQGRTRLGWKKMDGQRVPEQTHFDRMKGLGVGFASISLRDFSASSNKNPWPPSRYWMAMAGLANTPPAETTDTQCMVLRAMVALYEDKFIKFYGSAAIAALRKALVEVPAAAPNKTSAVIGLQVLAQTYRKDWGLDL